MNEHATSSILDRALGRVRRAFREAAGSSRVALAGTVRPDLPDDDAERLLRQVRACVAGQGGEVAARGRAADVGRAYLTLNDTGRGRFLERLASDLHVDEDQLEAALDELNAAEGAARPGAERRLRRALAPPYLTLFTHFNGLPQGVKFLVDLRADLLPLAKRNGALKVLNDDLKDLLASWFDTGFLELRRVTWQAPAAFLEKLIAYESVHEIRSWDDLKNRLDSDRRLYAFIHPNMPDEPLIFVEVALTDGVAANIQTLLDQSAPEQDPRRADTAIFYSISNAQEGLRGVSFGSFLIKRVVDALARDLPNVKKFATLSPIPGFRAWLGERIAAGDGELLDRGEIRRLRELSGADNGGAALGVLLNRPDWPADREVADALERPLLRLCASYLLTAREGRRARDRVANFHLSNGARVERINWLGDLSPRGLEQSAGMMVNYRYRLNDIERNHEAYRGEGRIVAAGALRNLLKD